jgi:hypothetical protein
MVRKNGLKKGEIFEALNSGVTGVLTRPMVEDFEPTADYWSPEIAELDDATRQSVGIDAPHAAFIPAVDKDDIEAIIGKSSRAGAGNVRFLRVDANVFAVCDNHDELGLALEAARAVLQGPALPVAEPVKPLKVEGRMADLVTKQIEREHGWDVAYLSDDQKEHIVSILLDTDFRTTARDIAKELEFHDGKIPAVQAVIDAAWVVIKGSLRMDKPQESMPAVEEKKEEVLKEQISVSTESDLRKLKYYAGILGKFFKQLEASNTDEDKRALKRYSGYVNDALGNLKRIKL